MNWLNGGTKGITKLSWNVLDCLECAEVVHNLKERELLELDGKNLQIRQVGVNEDLLDPMVAGCSFLELESSSKVGYSQMDRLRNL
ncbi:hypothetical protein F2Q69_00035594 [Brassica cretica]|uniref:Uncharacterized protein n=1 Tax=Brassica cretica TaxID=69181 RepID=A0A8S9SEB7_BRACR|nr:hypothetical protein F2Q69_00035594 [Brassica cretica]